MKKLNIISLLLCAAFCSSCGTNSVTFVTTSTENQDLTTTAWLNDEDLDAQQFKLLEDYPYVDNIIWTEYIADEAKPAETTTVTASEESSAEIPAPLAEYNVRDYFHAETMSCGNGYVYHLGSEFLTEEQRISFWLTYHFHFMFEIETSYFFDFSNIDFGERNADFYSTGFTYESVMNSLKTFMSEEIIKEITSDKCADIDGEFYCGIGAKGASADFDDYIEFAPVEITDEKVIFQVTARYANPDNSEEKSYYTYDYEMVYDNGNWIMTQFELWR